MDERIVLLIFFAIFIALFYLINYFVLSNYAKIFGLPKDYVFYVIVIFLSVSYLLAAGLQTYMNNILSRTLYKMAATWMGILFMLFIGVAIYFALNKIIPIPNLIAGIVILALVTIATVYGVVHAYDVRIKELDVYTDKNVSLKVVHISDLHIGPVNGKSYLSDVVEKVNGLNPDVVLITGDILDYKYYYYDDTLLPLNGIKADVFFINGNHDVYAGLESVKKLLEPTKVRWLRNELVGYRGIYLIGLDDSSDKNNVNVLLSAMNTEHDLKKKFSILMCHRPLGWKDAAKYVNLMVVGHTHAGQIWPFNYLTWVEGHAIHGVHKVPRNNDFMLYVSSGTGTWGPPIRIGSDTEIVVYKIQGNVPKDMRGEEVN